MSTYTHILDLAKEAEPPADGILSRTIFQDDKIKAVVFGFGQGQELSEHTAAKPAMLFFEKGEASVGLGDDVQEAQAGTWVHMPANLKHSINSNGPALFSPRTKLSRLTTSGPIPPIQSRRASTSTSCRTASLAQRSFVDALHRRDAVKAVVGRFPLA